MLLLPGDGTATSREMEVLLCGDGASREMCMPGRRCAPCLASMIASSLEFTRDRYCPPHRTHRSPPPGRLSLSLSLIFFLGGEDTILIGSHPIAPHLTCGSARTWSSWEVAAPACRPSRAAHFQQHGCRESPPSTGRQEPRPRLPTRAASVGLFVGRRRPRKKEEPLLNFLMVMARPLSTSSQGFELIMIKT
jgi:hypothetical protein